MQNHSECLLTNEKLGPPFLKKALSLKNQDGGLVLGPIFPRKACSSVAERQRRSPHGKQHSQEPMLQSPDFQTCRTITQTVPRIENSKISAFNMMP